MAQCAERAVYEYRNRGTRTLNWLSPRTALAQRIGVKGLCEDEEEILDDPLMVDEDTSESDEGVGGLDKMSIVNDNLGACDGLEESNEDENQYVTPPSSPQLKVGDRVLTYRDPVKLPKDSFPWGEAHVTEVHASGSARVREGHEPWGGRMVERKL